MFVSLLVNLINLPLYLMHNMVHSKYNI